MAEPVNVTVPDPVVHVVVGETVLEPKAPPTVIKVDDDVAPQLLFPPL